MVWLKKYSITLLVISMLLGIFSFYIIDFIPILYKFYMGREIASSKIEMLNGFGFKLINELRIYLLLLIVTFGFIYFISTLKQYFIVLAVSLLLHFLFIAEIGEFVIFRRFYQMLIMLPLLWIFFDFFKFKKESYETKITHGFLYITLLCLVLPGLYLPPFFTGISGWTVEIDKRDPVIIDGVFLVRDDGKEIRYSRAIVSPINFVTRLNSYMERAHPEKLNTLLTFYEETYKKRYDILEKGSVPSQKILGKFAFPTHNPHGDFNYSAYPPHRIKEIKISKKYYSWEKKFLKEEIIATKEWR